MLYSLTTNKEKTGRQLLQTDSPFTTVSSSQEDHDSSRGDGGSELGGFGFPSVVQRLLRVFSGVESGLEWGLG